jgi:hypothetical protein
MLSAALAAAWAGPTVASSHREAPFVATQPQVDATDFYMFRSYEPGRDGYVTLVANYVPLQNPYGGPNYFKLDPNAVYEIHVTNDGGAVENLTFQFRFQTTNDDNKFNVGGKMVSIPLVQNGSGDVATPNSPALNVHEKYTLSVIRGPRRTGAAQPVTNLSQGGTTFDKPVDYIGTKTIGNYVAYANKHIYDVGIPGCNNGRVFVGQRKDPFVVNLGETFDLVNIKYPAVELNPLAEFATVDSLADANVTSLVLEVPIACLTEGKGSVIGGWTTASVPGTRTVSATPGSGLDPTAQTGSLVQVSRLGMPLVNEVVIGLKDKNRFNASEPKDDGQFADYVTNPTLPTLLEALFGGAGVKAPTNYPRTDLVAVPDGSRGREQAGQRRGVRAGTAQHGHSGDARRRAEPAGRAGRRQRGLPERPAAGRRRRRHRAARRDGRAVHGAGRQRRGRLQGVRRARGRAQVHGRRVPEFGVLRQRVPVPARGVEGLAQRRQRGQGQAAGREVGGGRTGPGAGAPGPSHSEMPK